MSSIPACSQTPEEAFIVSSLHGGESAEAKLVRRSRDLTPSGPVNVGVRERWISLAAGAGLIAYGISRRSLGGAALAALGLATGYRGLTGFCPMYNALGLSTTSNHRRATFASTSTGAQPDEYFDQGIHISESVTIQKPASELYRFWRNFENLPRIMSHLKSVEVINDRRSHWIAKAPVGMKLEWDAEIINEYENELIAWRSLDGASVDNAGSVRFIPAPAAGGTIVRVTVEYIPPAGTLGQIVAKLLGKAPARQIGEDLLQFKQFMETGEVTANDGSGKQPGERVKVMLP